MTRELETVAACSSKPSKATRMRRSRPSPPSPPPVETADRRQLCEEMVQSGYVQSYVDFFYLTHRPDPNVAEKEIEVPPDEMVFLRDNLTRAETARRKGETEAVYESYSNVAGYFQHRGGDPKTGVYFYEKCLEIARLTGDFRGEMRANHDLGKASSLAGDVGAATKYHERQLEIARGLDESDETLEALRDLIDAYRAAAEEREAANDSEGAVRLRERCLEVARETGDAASEARAALALGTALRDDASEAIRVLELAEAACRNLDDARIEGKTCDALGAAWRSEGDDDRALEYLDRSLDLAVKTQDLHAQAAACRTLGVLHVERGDYDRGIDLFKRSFDLAENLQARGQADAHNLVDCARVHLRIATAMKTDPRLRTADDVPALLNNGSTSEIEEFLASKDIIIEAPDSSCT